MQAAPALRADAAAARREKAGGVGVRGASNKLNTSAASTILPPCHDIDLIAQLGDHAEVMGDDQQRQLRSLLSRRSVWITWFCTVASSAVVGSSATRICGSGASAIAISTRWRMPPDSSCG